MLFFSRLAAVLPPASRWRAQVVLSTIRGLRSQSAPLERTCNICNRKSFFKPSGWPIRPEVCCPHCGSLERHRLLKLWLDENPTVVNKKRLLHFAPERIVGEFLRPRAGKYVTAEISPGYDLQIDIESTGLPDKSFDVVVCAHVLEHVASDHNALVELHRIISVGGAALLMVPIVEGWPKTYEDKTITDRNEREAYFGQDDHLRYFGADFREKVKLAGFDLDEFTSEGPDVVRYGLHRGEKLFIATRAR